MRQLRAVAASVLSVFVLGLIGGGLPDAQAQPPPPVEIVFPGDAKFSELESKLQEKTRISGAAWVDEFKRHQVLGQVRSVHGLVGTLFLDSVATINVLTGQTPFIVYGTITIPAGAQLGQRDFSGGYGIVIFTGSLIIALIDLNTGSIGALVVVPTEGQTIIVAPFFFPFFSPVGIFQILFALITVPASAPPTPPALPTPTCPAELANKSDVNVSLSAPVTIASVKDGAGNALFEIGGAPPGVLTVQSFGASLQFVYTVSVQRRVGFIIGPGTARILLSPEIPFSLWVTTGEKTACLQARPKVGGGVITIVGTLATN
jgi:hypothetical protein